jgi:hypothetical protein
MKERTTPYYCTRCLPTLLLVAAKIIKAWKYILAALQDASCPFII